MKPFHTKENISLLSTPVYSASPLDHKQFHSKPGVDGSTGKPHEFNEIVLPFLNQACAHSRPLRASGLLKLFSEKCMYVCMFVYLFVFPHLREQNFVC